MILPPCTPTALVSRPVRDAALGVEEGTVGRPAEVTVAVNEQAVRLPRFIVEMLDRPVCRIAPHIPCPRVVRMTRHVLVFVVRIHVLNVERIPAPIGEPPEARNAQVAGKPPKNVCRACRRPRNPPQAVNADP